MVASASLASNVTCMSALKEAGGVDLFLMLLHSPSLLEAELAAASLCNIVAELDPAVEGTRSQALVHSLQFQLNPMTPSHHYRRTRRRQTDELGARGWQQFDRHQLRRCSLVAVQRFCSHAQRAAAQQHHSGVLFSC